MSVKTAASQLLYNKILLANSKICDKISYKCFKEIYDVKGREGADCIICQILIFYQRGEVIGWKLPLVQIRIDVPTGAVLLKGNIA